MALLSTLALTGSTYSVLLSDGNGNVIGGPTYERLPSREIGPALVAYLLSLEDDNVIRGYFADNITYSDRQDFQARAVPSIDFYAEKQTYSGSFGWLTGRFIVKVSLPIQDKRELAVDTCHRLCDYLTLILNGTNCIEFVGQYAAGCVSVALDIDWDFADSIAAEGINKVDVYIAKGVGKYEVSMLEYYEKKWDYKTYRDATIKVKPV